MPATAILIAIAAQAPLVTYSAPAERVSDLLPKLSLAAGVRLEASGSLEDEVLLVRLHEVPRQRVLDEIARVTLGRWSPVEGGLRLVGDPDRRRKMDDQRVQREASSIRRAIKAFQNQVLKGKFDQLAAKELANKLTAPGMRQGFEEEDLPDRSRQRRALIVQAPSGRLVARLLDHVDWEALIREHSDRAVTLAYPANRAQIPLPTSVQPLIETYLAEQREWSRLAGRFGDRDHDLRESFHPLSGYRKVLLDVSFSGFGGAVANLSVIDNRGLGFRMLVGVHLSESTEAPRNPGTAGNQDREPIRLSSAGEREMAYYRSLWSGQNPGEFRELREIIADPVRHEPLSRIPSELIRASFAPETSLILNLPDLFASMGSVTRGEPYTVSTVRSIVDRVMDVRESDGLASGHLHPESMRDFGYRLSRRDWKAVGDEQDRLGGLTIETRAALAAKNPSAFTYQIYITAVLSMRGVPSFVPDDYDGLRLYGSLSQTQRKALLEGRTISVSQLSAQARAHLHALLLDWQSRFGILQPTALARTALEIGQQNFLSRTPTEAFPEGLPGSAVLVGSEKLLQTLFSPQRASVNGLQPAMRVTPDQIAQVLFHRERPEAQPWIAQTGLDLSGEYCRGGARDVQIGVELKPGHQMIFRLKEDFPSPNQRVNIDSLPPEISVEVQKSLERYREMFKGQTGGTSRPPPPR